MKLIYMEPVLEEIEKQQEYFEQAEDYDCAEAVMSAKWAVIDAKEVEAIPIEWLRAQMKNNPNDIESAYDDICISELIEKWKKEQET